MVEEELPGAGQHSDGCRVDVCGCGQVDDDRPLAIGGDPSEHRYQGR
jgi:hypothetical protein